MNSNIFYLLVFVACLSSAYCASLKFGDKAFLYKKTFGCNETNTECNKPANPKQDEGGELMVTLKNSWFYSMVCDFYLASDHTIQWILKVL